jgi:osmotically-inducible protein OsmY
MRTTIQFHPSLESATSAGEIHSTRTSLFDTKDNFIQRIAPVGVAAIYFGSFTLSPQDAPLSRQALFKLSFLNRHYLQPGGLKVAVNRHTAILSGTITHRSLATMAEILALQIEGIQSVKDETTLAADALAPAASAAQRETEALREAVQFLFATDQTLRSGVQVSQADGQLVLQGEVSSAAQKSWAEQLAEAAGGIVQSKIKVSEAITFAATHLAEPPQVDDESLQALVHFRLRLVRETEHLPVRIKATRGVVAAQGKVRTEALRQRVENISRSTLGLRELRSSLAIAP